MDNDQFINSGCDKLITPASELKKNRLVDKEIISIVKDQLKVINARIVDSYKNRATTCHISLPTTFDICEIPNDEIQRNVYTKILRVLEFHKYNLKISLTKTSCVLTVSWDGEQGETEKNNELAYLRRFH
jgi:hypothetical protein